jgi:hypothetical protein
MAHHNTFRGLHTLNYIERRTMFFECDCDSYSNTRDDITFLRQVASYNDHLTLLFESDMLRESEGNTYRRVCTASVPDVKEWSEANWEWQDITPI